MVRTILLKKRVHIKVAENNGIKGKCILEGLDCQTEKFRRMYYDSQEQKDGQKLLNQDSAGLVKETNAYHRKQVF